MADAIQTQNVGAGEGVIPCTSSETSTDVKPEDPAVPEATKADSKSSVSDVSTSQSVITNGSSDPVAAIKESEIAVVKDPEIAVIKVPEVTTKEAEDAAIKVPEEIVKGPTVTAIEEVKVGGIKEPEAAAINKQEDAAIKALEVAAVVEPEVAAVKEPEIAAVKEPEVAASKESEVTAVKEPGVAAVVEPEIAAVKEPDVAAIKEPEATVCNGQSKGDSNEVGDWQKREKELLKKIEELEKVKKLASEDGLRSELRDREAEIDLLKARVRNLETELQAALSKPSGKNHEMIENIKQQHEDLLSKARGMIFDKTKMVKNQELQIEALTTQVQSLKDINQITKDLLEIRNSEVKAMEDRFQAMEARYKAENERHSLVLQRAQTSTNINVDLRKEYETQLAIFKELREKYEQKTQALIAENTRLKESLQKESSTSQK